MQYAKAIHLYDVERGKCFRLVAEVVADGEKMRALLLARGLARRDDGGKRERSFWCWRAGGE